MHVLALPASTGSAPMSPGACSPIHPIGCVTGPIIGALGSRRTQARRAAGLRAAGLDDADLTRIHGPAGLDLGAARPEEIALAVVAELLAVLRRAPATSLSARDGPIHRVTPD